MDVGDVRAWYDEYLRAFAACGRGESDEAALALTTEDEGVNAARRQIDGMRAANYDRSEMHSETVALNATSALHTG